jgi:hypothetical protein
MSFTFRFMTSFNSLFLALGSASALLELSFTLALVPRWLSLWLLWLWPWQLPQLFPSQVEYPS